MDMQKAARLDKEVLAELRTGQDTWQVFKIMGEFVDGFETLRKIGRAVSIFGSARMRPGERYYELAVEVAERFAKKGWTTITGGGPGIMEAANKGAKKGGGLSVGLNIKLPFEQSANPFQDIALEFDYFFARKVMFVKYAQAYVVLPGGFGTMDELFESLTLVQTGKVQGFPVILIGKEFYGGLLRWMRKEMVAAGTISPEDTSLFLLTDDPEEAVEAAEHFHHSGETMTPETLAAWRRLWAAHLRKKNERGEPGGPSTGKGRKKKHRRPSRLRGRRSD